MCGIAGLQQSRAATRDARVAVGAMCERMRRRGPDAQGLEFYDDGRLVLGHRRLAIIDVDPRANQPFASACGDYAIVFNGEIYNYRELREALVADGEALRTTSDTEVVLALYRRHGVAALSMLRGMFAFAIRDARRGVLFLARDAYGIKPLYVATLPDGFAFASQVKALREAGLHLDAQDPAGLAGFLLWGSVPEPWTLYRDIRALPAGHWLEVRDGVPGTPQCWHDIRDHWRAAAPELGEAEVGERVTAAVRDSVRAHLVADVPVSVFLSGGVDSGVLAGIAAALDARVEGVTIGFDEFAAQSVDEVPPARAIAAHYGIAHHVRRVTRAEFEADLPAILDAMDQPSVDGINTWFASKAVAERGYKVVLSGVGGDELFCGYASFQQIPRFAGVGRVLAATPGARALARPVARWLAQLFDLPRLAAVPELMGSVEGWYFLRRGLHLPHEAHADTTALPFPWPCSGDVAARDAVSAVGLMESCAYLKNQLLRDSDWASMAHSVELRTPFVDTTLLAALGPLARHFAGGRGKALLAACPPRPLPEEILTRRKTGFGVPMGAWIAQHAADTIDRPAAPWARRWARSLARRFAAGAP